MCRCHTTARVRACFRPPPNTRRIRPRKLRSFAMRLPVSRSLVLPTCFAVFGLIAAQGVGLAQDDAKSGKSDTAKAAASPLKSDAPKIPVEIRDLLENRQYPQAIAAIDAAMKVKDAPRDYLEYLKARALHLQQKYDDAVAAYELWKKNSRKAFGPSERNSAGRFRWLGKGISNRPSEFIARKPSGCCPPIASRKSPSCIWNSPTRSSNRKTRLQHPARLRQGAGVLQQSAGSRPEAGNARPR